MTRTEFEALVMRLESAGAEQKQSYRLKVAVLAAAGYAYIFTVLLILILFAALVISRGGGIAIVKFGIPLGALAWAVLRALWVRWPQPEGIQIKEAQAPSLFKEVEAIRSKLGAPRIHRVFVNDAYNAAMEQRPRLGIFGWPEGILHVGLPLMHALSAGEFRAVLAHEMGHLSGNHGRITGWVYRLRNTWSRLLQCLEQEGRWGSVLFTKFLQWYAPFLNAYSFVLARAQEYEADRCAAYVVGKDAAARVLVAVRVRGMYLDEEFWPRLWKVANDQDSPPSDVYLQQASSFRQNVPAMDTRRWVTQSLSTKTGYVDTHPSLHDRLAALGAPVSAAQWAEGVDRLDGPSAAVVMLGPNVETWYRDLNKNWSTFAAPPWKSRYQEVQEQRKQLAEMREKNSSSTLNEEEAWEFANLVNSLEGDEAALPHFLAVVEKNGEHVSANLAVGRMLLQKGDAQGLLHLTKAMTRDPDCTPGACYLAEQFLLEQGNPKEAESYHRRALEYADLSDDADKERQTITSKDSFLPHGIEPEVIAAIRAHMARYLHLKTAYLVRKDVKVFPERPAYVLGLVPKTKWYGLTDTEADATLLNLVARDAPAVAGTYIILLNSSKPLRKKIERVTGSRIYG